MYVLVHFEIQSGAA